MEDIQQIGADWVKDTLMRMKMGSVVGFDEIPIEVWKCLGDVGEWWLPNLFDNILGANKMSSE